MKKTSFLLIALVAISFFACTDKASVEDLKKFAATENYPVDVFLDSVRNKKALVIVAHDDDDCAMAGTIAKLTAHGWAIKQLSLQSHINAGTGKNPADIICQNNELILKDGYYRLGSDTIKSPYLPIPYKSIKDQYLTDKVAGAISEKINEFKPSVVFTLDNEKGGYGHPDHIFISQLVKDLFDGRKIEIEKIYQGVYTDHMEISIFASWHPLNTIIGLDHLLL